MLIITGGRFSAHIQYMGHLPSHVLRFRFIGIYKVFLESALDFVGGSSGDFVIPKLNLCDANMAVSTNIDTVINLIFGKSAV